MRLRLGRGEREFFGEQHGGGGRRHDGRWLAQGGQGSGDGCRERWRRALRWDLNLLLRQMSEARSGQYRARRHPGESRGPLADAGEVAGRAGYCGCC